MYNTTIKILLLIIIIILFVLIKYILKLSNFTNDPQNIIFPGSQSKIPKKDCSIQNVYSTNDMQCNIICQPPNVYISKNGICVNALVTQSEITQNECSPEKGVLSYIVGDSQFGKTSILCLSIDTGIQPDNPKGQNKICTNGNIDINYIKSFPEISNCECEPNNFPAIIEATSTIRKHATCVNSILNKLL